MLFQFISICTDLVKNVEKYLGEVKHIGIPKFMDNPISNRYWSDPDETAELEHDDTAYHQLLIGMMRWIAFIPDNNIKFGNFNVALADCVINVEVLLYQWEKEDDTDHPLLKARALRYLTFLNGNLVGIPNENLKLDTKMYKVEFPDGSREQYSVNVIAQKIYSQHNQKNDKVLSLKK